MSGITCPDCKRRFRTAAEWLDHDCPRAAWRWRRLALAVLAVLLAAGCAVPDPTTRPPTATFPAEPPTTATTAPPTTLAAADCPMVVVECPRPWVTPGAVIPSSAGVCSPSFNPRRELNVSQKRRVLKAYGIDVPADKPLPKPAEWDHLTPRWAGGASTPENLWPQFSARDRDRKDALEDQLYHAVCVAKTMTLATARDRALHFWRFWPAKSTTLRGTHAHD